MEVTSYNIQTNLIDQQRKVESILKDESSSFFVLNYSDLPNKSGVSTQEAAPIVMTVMVDGQARLIRIPYSWVPVDLGLQAPKRAIRDSVEFQRCLTSRAIVVLTQEEAEKIITADEVNSQEYGRVMAVAQRVNGADQYNYGSNSRMEEPEDPWKMVSNEAKLQVEQFEENIITESDFRNYLLRSKRSLSALDRQYIADKLPDFNFMG